MQYQNIQKYVHYQHIAYVQNKIFHDMEWLWKLQQIVLPSYDTHELAL